jgi:AraC family transcriptional regulator
MDYRIKEAVDFIDANLQRSLKLLEIARFLGLSPSRARHIFTAAVGLSPMRYVRLRRMQRAKVLLEETRLSVKEVMTKVGVSDQSHFVRDFYTVYGLTPGKYRSNHFNARE